MSYTTPWGKRENSSFLQDDWDGTAEIWILDKNFKIKKAEHSGPEA